MLKGLFVFDSNERIFGALILANVTGTPLFFGANCLLLLGLGLRVLRQVKVFSKVLLWEGRGGCSFEEFSAQIPAYSQWTGLFQHIGAFVVFGAMLFGAGDFRRVRIHLELEEASSRAVENENPIALPFSFTLHDFRLDNFPPELILTDTAGTTAVHNRQASVVLEETGLNQELLLGAWKIAVIALHKKSVKQGELFLDCALSETCQDVSKAIGVAALIRACRRSGGAEAECKEGWVFQGSRETLPQRLQLEENVYLALAASRPRSFQSRFTFTERSANFSTEVVVEVNRPWRYGWWTVYQLDYDVAAGQYSTSSVLELVYDPWNYVVYMGFAWFAFGSILLIFSGKPPVKE